MQYHIIQVSHWFQFLGQAGLSTVVDHLYVNQISGMDHITQVSIFLGIVCIVIMGISHQDGDFILKLLNMLLYLAFMTGGPMHPNGEEVMKQMPQEIQSLLSKFDLESCTIIYAVYPACDCTYEPEILIGSNLPTSLSTCTNIPHPEADICGEHLL